MAERLLCLISGMNLGGAETFLMKNYRQLDKEKYQMDFCLNVKEKCAYEDEILSLGGKIYRIPSKSENRAQFEADLSRIVKENNYQNVLRITSNGAGFLDLKIAKQAGAAHTVARSSNASDGKGLKLWAVHRLGKFLWLKFVDTMVAPSDLAAVYSFGKKNFKAGKVTLLHNGLDLSVYRFDTEKRKAIRESLQIPANATVLGHVGRFFEQKNHRFLIDVFHEYHKKHGNSYLMLVGKGELEDEIREKVAAYGLQQYVIFTGTQSDVPAYLSAMDGFVFPSFYEGMPNTVIEAQACGLPCLISSAITKQANVSGRVEFLSLNVSAADWAKKLEAEGFLSRYDCTAQMVAQKYDIASVAEEFTKLMFQGIEVKE